MNFAKILETLADGHVRFILIGGVAAYAHGSARVTVDIDIVYSRDRENIERLAKTLAPLAPYLRGAPPGLPFRFDADTVERGLNFTLSTSLGPLDVLGDIPGGGGYDDLIDHAIALKVFDHDCHCLDLPTLIHVKRAAGRPKDLEAIAELELLWDSQRKIAPPKD